MADITVKVEKNDTEYDILFDVVLIDGEQKAVLNFKPLSKNNMKFIEDSVDDTEKEHTFEGKTSWINIINKDDTDNLLFSFDVGETWGSIKKDSEKSIDLYTNTIMLKSSTENTLDYIVEYIY